DWRSNHPHRAGHDSSFATNPFRKHRLVTGANWNCRVRHVTTRGTIDEIDAYLLQLAASVTDSLIFQPPSTQSVDEMRRNNGNSFGHSDRTAAMISRHSRVRFSNEPP